MFAVVSRLVHQKGVDLVIGAAETVVRAGGQIAIMGQRFGSLPIARRTGGLADSIEDGLTGFLFRAISVESCLEAVTRAFNAFGNRDIFVAMRKSAMARNFGWAKPALCYQQLYGRAIDGFPHQRVA